MQTPLGRALVALAPLMLTTPVMAQGSFQHQADLSLGTRTSDFGDGFWQASYQYYFIPVDVTGPYALADFLTPRSSLRAAYFTFDSEVDSYSLGGTYHTPSNWQGSFDYTHSNTRTTDYDRYRVTLGYYWLDTGLLSLSYENTEQDGSGYSYDMDEFGVNWRHFWRYQGDSGLDWSLDYRHQSHSSHIYLPDWLDGWKESVNVYHGRADWYFNRSWYLGAAVHYHDGIEDFDYRVRTGYWWQFSRHVALNSSLGTDFDSDESGVAIGLALVGRF
ncbi:putative porin [Ferrimonas marina]|uniref:Uncharacterized protein n=1 Tax=Ferrimonas marina TaxID=299255 RepID=A0A1M5ZLZ6_9GAMM|nr:putative porin [Ferrimonas marina]SHI24953.1 hypothetical protein SAMN02745129_0399 [Ferrimonas marina]